MNEVIIPLRFEELGLLEGILDRTLGSDIKDNFHGSSKDKNNLLYFGADITYGEIVELLVEDAPITKLILKFIYDPKLLEYPKFLEELEINIPGLHREIV